MRKATIIAALGWLELAATAAQAGNLLVAPTRVDLGPGRTTGVVNLQNRADEPVMVQVETFAWAGSMAAADLTATDDLIAVPPVASLAPGGTQIIRVALRHPQVGSREVSYRLLITEVPSAGNTGGVQFALRLSLPVFATPPGAAPRPLWELRRGAAGVQLALVNDGEAHLQIHRIKLTSGDRAVTIDKPVYVLAGQQHEWPFELPVAGSAPIALEADTNLGPIAQQIAAPAH